MGVRAALKSADAQVIQVGCSAPASPISMLAYLQTSGIPLKLLLKLTPLP